VSVIQYCCRSERQTPSGSFFMKWVTLRDGLQRLVDNDDPRPAVKTKKKPMGIPFIPYSPTWKKYEKDMWNTDYKHSSEATDKFIAEREHETKTDPKAARWEQSRKAGWAKDKPLWVKRGGR